MAKKQRKNTGLPPGSVVFTGERKVERIKIHYLEYSEAEFREQELDNQTISSFHSPMDALVQWYDVHGLHDTELIREMGKVFGVHPLVLEYIADTEQRPKLDQYQKGIFVVLKAFVFNRKEEKAEVEQVALFLGEGFVLSFQEKADDLFAGVKHRLRSGIGRIRKRGADYLLCALLDAIVDQYFLELDALEDAIDSLEKELLETLSNEYRSRIFDLKRELMVIRRAINPMREFIPNLIDLETELIGEATEVFFRDLRDKVHQILEDTDSYRDHLTGLQDLFLSEMSFQLNRVMQTLTIVAAIFIPLTFLTSIYGMNFKNMPELGWKYGYFGLLGIMLLVALLMIWYFRRKKWL